MACGTLSTADPQEITKKRVVCCTNLWKPWSYKPKPESRWLVVSTADPQEITVRVEYEETPPQVFISQLNKFIRENQPPNFVVKLRWESVATEDPQPSQHTNTQETFCSHPRGYRHSSKLPALCGQDHCLQCLCAPCVVAFPPDFLRGSCSPHPANDGKRHRLYRLFWRLLKDLGLWHDGEYFQRKEEWSVGDDRLDIIPKCVMTEIRSRYPSHDGNYHDYLSTFDAETDY